MDFLKTGDRVAKTNSRRSRGHHNVLRDINFPRKFRYDSSNVKQIAYARQAGENKVYKSTVRLDHTTWSDKPSFRML